MSRKFQSDVRLPTALPTGRLGAQRGVGVNGAGEDPKAHFDKLEEDVNRTIDVQMEQLVDGFKELITLSSVGDKDKFRIGQEAFQAEVRADSMVRAAQSLASLSQSLKLSLLLSKTPNPDLDDEARDLMQKTAEERVKVGKLLEKLMGHTSALEEDEEDQVVEKQRKEGGGNGGVDVEAGKESQGPSDQLPVVPEQSVARTQKDQSQRDTTQPADVTMDVG